MYMREESFTKSIENTVLYIVVLPKSENIIVGDKSVLIRKYKT